MVEYSLKKSFLKCVVIKSIPSSVLIELNYYENYNANYDFKIIKMWKQIDKEILIDVHLSNSWYFEKSDVLDGLVFFKEVENIYWSGNFSINKVCILKDEW